MSAPSSRTDALLAEANLFRLRAQWTEAEKRCVDVMRADAHSVAAHTLLGDIYRDQGKADEARQWYQMALDLDPESRTIPMKLREVEGARPIRPAPRPKGAVAPSPSAAPLGTQNLMGLSPASWFRFIWVLCGVFIVAVAGVVIWVRAHPRPLTFMPAGTIPGTPAGVPDAVRTLPDGRQRTPDNSVSGTRYGPPVRSGAAPDQPRRSPTAGQSPVANAVPANTPAIREQALAAQIGRSGSLPADMALAGLRVESGAQKVTLQMIHRPSATSSDAEMRPAVVRAALAAAQSVFSSEPACQTVTIETRVSTPDGQNQPFFAADIDRMAAQRVDTSLRDEDRLSNVWWASPQTAGEPNHP